MNIAELQKAIGTAPDGRWGPASRSALLDHFTNKRAAAITPGQEQAIADRLSISLKQLRAVAKVESSGSGFDSQGRPKILFERHYFHRLTSGKWSPAIFSDAKPGGYGDDSWNKLLAAAGCDPDAAFASISWGQFQVMGAHWKALRYASPFALASSTVTDQAAHYELLARFIERNNLNGAMSAISTDPEDCRAFARAYNGVNYAAGRYHEKIARAMR